MENPRTSQELMVRSFGGLSFCYAGSPITILWESQKARCLFCYLMCDCYSWTGRNKLVEMLWPGVDASAGAKNFKTTLNRLRKSFSGSNVIDPVETYKDSIRINQNALKIDACEFRQNAILGIKLLSRGEYAGARQFLESAQDLYLGEFLPEEPLDDFLRQARAQFAALHASVLACLEKIYHEQGNQTGLETFRLLTKITKLQEAP